MCSGEAREDDADLLLSVANQIEGRTICAFGEAAAWPTQSFVKKFRKDFVKKAKTQKRKKDSFSTHIIAMISPTKGKTVNIVLDGNEVEVPAGINLVDAAALFNKEIPHYCYHPQLSVAGNCRMCLIEMGTPMRDRATGEPVLDEDGSPKIGWVPKPVIGCATTVSPGMHVKTISEKVTDCREGIMEFLLVNHPLDCPICDQAGECRLQEFATDYGRGYSRYVERKNVKPKRARLGPRVTLDDERCILCSRCIRFCQEVANDDVLGFVDRGSYSTLTCFPGKELKNNYSLNTVDLCPVGALTSTDFRFKMRVWFLKESSSICAESSARM